MFRSTISLTRALALVLALLVGPAQAQMTLLGAGGTPKVASVSYTGPGDIVPSAVYWYGLRGYSAAYASPGTNCAVDLEDQAGANPLICVVILSNGNLDTSTISTWVTAHSVTTIVVTKMYDQTGNGNHITNTGALSAHPTLTLNAIGSRPALSFNGANSQVLGITVTTHAQPWTISMAAKVNSSTTGGFAGVFTPNTNVGPFGLTNTMKLDAGVGPLTTTDTFGSFRVYQFVGNGASSSIKIDTAAPVTGNAGTNGLGNFNLIGQAPAGTFLTGNILDVGWWISAISPTDQASLQSNSKTYWGF